MAETTNIYILKLENDKWYIGKSDNPEQRYTQHKNSYGSAWTSKHAPIELFKIIENVSPFQEDAITKEYMSLYGIDNVRGGSYVRIELSQVQKDYIQRELWSMNNLCNNCGSSEHWVRSCHIVEHTSQEPIVESSNVLLSTPTNSITNFFSKIKSCLFSCRLFRVNT